MQCKEKLRIERIERLFHVCLDSYQIIFFLHILDPLGCLALGIYHQRPPPGIGHYHAIVHREVILWKAGYLPLSYLDLLNGE